jgi:hypothetical protein
MVIEQDRPVLSTAVSTAFRVRCWFSRSCLSGFTTSSERAVANTLQKIIKIKLVYFLKKN